jgi:hypothetical protein
LVVDLSVTRRALWSKGRFTHIYPALHLITEILDLAFHEILIVR